MENTLKNKEKFFAQYWGPKICFTETCNGYYKTFVEYCLIEGISKEDYLELKPISQISDEDAIEVFDILFSKIANHKEKPKYFKIEYGSLWSKCVGKETFGQLFPASYIEMIDYLRSKGYALPFMGISVETLIYWGWLKLKEGE